MKIDFIARCFLEEEDVRKAKTDEGICIVLPDKTAYVKIYVTRKESEEGK
jgi:hypothetical protein